MPRTGGGGRGEMTILAVMACVETGIRGVDAPSPATDVEPASAEAVGEGSRIPTEVTAASSVGSGEHTWSIDSPKAAFLFEDGSVHEIRIELDGAAEDDLAATTTEEVPATVWVDGLPWPDVGVQLKGTTSYRPLGQKASFKLDFGAFVDGQEVHGLRRLILNNMVQDDSMLREHVAFRLFTLAGAPSLRHGYARVWVNDEEYGLYGLLETPDQDLLDRLWPGRAEGNLYEGGFGADFMAGREERFQLEEEGVYELHADIYALVEALDEASGSEFEALVEARFAERQFYRWLALDLAIGNNDGYAFNRNNFFAYHGDDDRWRMIPWGLDQAFRADNDVHSGAFRGRLAQECWADDRCEDLVEEAMLEVLTIWESREFQEWARDAAALVGPLCEVDPLREDPCIVDDLFAFLADRPDTVRGQIR